MDDTPQPEELQLGDSFAQILTETTQSLVCVLDREGRIRLFNEACERATGYSRTILDGGSLRLSPANNAAGLATLSMAHSYWPRISTPRMASIAFSCLSHSTTWTNASRRASNALIIPFDRASNGTEFYGIITA